MTRGRASGVVTLGRLLSWDRWVNRRIESLEIKDPLRFMRKVSLDFRYPHNPPAPEYSPDSEPIMLVPLTFLRKRTLLNFSLRDEAGGVLPLLTRTQNANVAASVLAAYAEWKADTAWGDAATRSFPLKGQPLPREIFQDLLQLAIEDRADALESWELLGRARHGGGGEPSQHWRDAMVTDWPFMSLARDLALNYLVLTPVVGRRGQRRVLKFRYEELLEPPVARIRIQAQEFRARRNERRAARRLSEQAGPVGTLRASATLKSLAGSEPCKDVAISVMQCEGSMAPERCVFKQRGGRSLAVQLPVGKYVVRPVVPEGLAQFPPGPKFVQVEMGGDSDVDFQFVRGTEEQPRGEQRDRETRPSLPQRLATGLGFRPKRIVVITPSIGHGGSYHFEAEAPEGLFVSRATLHEKRASAATRGDEQQIRPREQPHSSGARQADADKAEARPLDVDENRERVHLTASAVPQDSSGIVTLHLRPRPWTVVRPACLSAIFTTAVLFAVALRWPEIGTNAGAVSTLLLIVPGGLAAWAARSQEHPMTTEILFGLRMLALAAGLWAFVGAAALVLNRKYSAGPGGSATLGPAWNGTDLTLQLLFAASAVTALMLGFAWSRIVRLKENS